MAAEEDTYAARLRKALERDGWSQGRLAKELAAATGNARESERSAVQGYLRGSHPSSKRAKLIAQITGVGELAFVNARRSAAARLEDRLEALAAEVALLLQSADLGHEKLDRLLTAVEDGFQQQRARPKRKGQ